MMAWPDHVPIVVPIIIGTGLIPRMEELESLILYGKPVSANKRAPRKATPLMKLVAWLAMAANASWIWQLYHRETSTDFAILIVQGLVGADLCSGVYHWFQDSFRSTSESINAALFDNFQIHHELPYLIVKHDWEYVSWELFAGALVGHMLGWLYADVGDYPVFRCTMTFVACINHVHRLAHMRNPFPGGFDLPWPFQGRKHHAMHHKRPELRTYCILTVLNNWWMDALGVWELLEWIIFQCTGCVSFRMAVADPKQYQVASNFSLKDVAGHGQGVPSTSLFSTAKHWIPKLLSSR